MISPATLFTAYTVFWFACFLIPPWGETNLTRSKYGTQYRLGHHPRRV